MLGSNVTLTIVVESGSGVGQVSSLQLGGDFCNLDRSPCTFDVDCLSNLRLSASPSEFQGWAATAACMPNENNMSLGLTMIQDCTATAFFGVVGS